MENKIKAYKGFNKDLTCRGFQYEVGKKYKHKGDVAPCSSGFHACENPLDVLGYYPPSTEDGISRYCEVEQGGTVCKEGDKSCSSKLHIKAEIGLTGLVTAGVKFILDRVKWNEAKESNTGDQSAATNTGNQSAATNTGYRSAASVEGKESIAIVTGYDSKAKGARGNWLVLTERDSNWHILDVKAVKVDGKRIKADTWYKLVDGKVQEVTD